MKATAYNASKSHWTYPMSFLSFQDCTILAVFFTTLERVLLYHARNLKQLTN